LLLVISIGLFHGLAPAGTVSDVVVCIPLCHRQTIKSPTATFSVAGVNAKLATLTLHVAATLPDMLVSKTAATRSNFFICISLADYGTIAKHNVGPPDNFAIVGPHSDAEILGDSLRAVALS
jgi:hypothetical protein